MLMVVAGGCGGMGGRDTMPRLAICWVRLPSGRVTSIETGERATVMGGQRTTTTPITIRITITPATPATRLPPPHQSKSTAMASIEETVQPDSIELLVEAACERSEKAENRAKTKRTRGGQNELSTAQNNTSHLLRCFYAHGLLPFLTPADRPSPQKPRPSGTSLSSSPQACRRDRRQRKRQGKD